MASSCDALNYFKCQNLVCARDFYLLSLLLIPEGSALLHAGYAWWKSNLCLEGEQPLQLSWE